MNSIKLSKRLQAIANCVIGKRVVDVGCDHGKVAYYLIANNIAEYVICTDISAPSVAKAEKLLQENKIAKSKYDIRCGDGLETVSSADRLDTTVIAGMGGYETIKILQNADFLTKTLVLQPQRNWVDVKKYVLSVQYSIVYDRIIFDDGKYYNIIICQRDCNNSDAINEFQLHYGKDNYVGDTQDFVSYLAYEEEKLQKILSKVAKDDRQLVETMLNLNRQAKQKLGDINE